MTDTVDTEQALIEFYNNKIKLKELEERNKEIIADLGLAEISHGTYEFGKFEVVVSRNARFDSAKATKMFPLGENGENMELYKAQVDSALAKAHMDTADYEACQKEFPNNKVEVRLV